MADVKTAVSEYNELIINSKSCESMKNSAGDLAILEAASVQRQHTIRWEDHLDFSLVTMSSQPNDRSQFTCWMAFYSFLSRECTENSTMHRVSSLSLAVNSHTSSQWRRAKPDLHIKHSRAEDQNPCHQFKILISACLSEKSTKFHSQFTYAVLRYTATQMTKDSPIPNFPN